MSAREKIAYMKGLLDGGSQGAQLDPVYRALTTALDAIVEELEELREDMENQRDATKEIFALCEQFDEDLTILEELLLDDDSDDDFDMEEYDADELDEEYDEAECPSCGLRFFYHPTLAPEEGIQCPDCNEKLEVTIVDEDPSNG